MFHHALTDCIIAEVIISRYTPGILRNAEYVLRTLYGDMKIWGCGTAGMGHVSVPYGVPVD